MSRQVQADDFTRSGALGTMWRNNNAAGFGFFELDGDFALPDEDLISGASHNRSQFTQFDPKIIFPLDQFDTVSGGPTQQLTTILTFRLPDTLPSAPQTLEVSAIALGKALPTSSEFGVECQYIITSTGQHQLRAVERSNAGAVTILPGSVRDLTGAGTALAAGESAQLRATVLFRDLFTYQFLSSWLPPGSTDTRTDLHTANRNWPNPPTGPTTPGGPQVANFFGGMRVYQEGPFTGGASGTLTDRVKVDNWGVVDESQSDSRQLYPTPVLPARTLGARQALPTAERRDAGPFPIAPSWAIGFQIPSSVNEFRAEDGYVIAHSGSRLNRPVLPLTWAMKSDAERETLRSFMRSLEGGYSTASFQVPGSQEVLHLRPIEPVTFQHVGPGVWTASGQFEVAHA